ncbi:TetR/AcrR family transcriptional regulator [Pseudoduganella lutea]|uniref:TetR/AcrR family transcriptional regulator n=1 Tax=Pseudoduganella lutea TaxID=321985 RepID=A0A4P6L5I6_9BURK|nr:TetR/AcrR family transcriptional regulator [Pseudoduganella lutea]QBE66777.1 TetR/AcrR family transcriptional regulator [Pseudoduganella lutea]
MRTKSDERRHHILQVAAATFSELGFENTTMSDIVSRIGGSKSTIYSYFPSKDVLAQAVLAHTAQIRLQQAFQALDTARPLRDVLRQFGRTYLVQLLAPEMLSAVRMAQQNTHRTEHGKHFYEAGPRTGWTIIQKFLEHHTQAGTILPCDGWVAAMHLKGLLQGELLERAMFGEQITAVRAIHQVADRAIEVFLRAYGAPGA